MEQRQKDEQAFKVSYACIMEADVCGPTMRGPTMEQRRKDEQAFKVYRWTFTTGRVSMATYESTSRNVHAG